MATDKRLDQVSTLTDFDYALIVKGDQVAKASKQQLAELVGNLLYGATNASSLATVVAGAMVKIINEATSLDEFVKTGIYGSFLFQNAPQNSIGTSILEVIAYSSNYIIQRFSVIDGSVGFYARKKNGSSWSSWVRIDNV